MSIVLEGGGETGALMRAIDWSRTPLGPVSGWSQALRTTVGLLLRNRFPMLLWWGPEFVQLYNDAYVPIPGAKHPQAFGQAARECWPEIWHIIGPMVEAPYSGQPATWSDDLFVLMNRKGFLEETHFKVAYSPVPDDTVQPTGVGGVLATVAETTEQVCGERQLKTLRALGARAADAKTPTQACDTAALTFSENSFDVPFALLYLVEPDGKSARLASSCGFEAESSAANPSVIELQVPAAENGWPVARLVETRAVEILTDLETRFGALPRGRWSESPRSAIGLPLVSPDQARPYGVLIAGCSPHRALDEGYRTFFELAAAQVITAVRNASALEEQRQRAEKLAELDRAKTAFFSNVSHEFRTPLTLMLGPLEDASSSAEQSLSGVGLEITYRNSLRLLKLVNTLLDFSRIEAGRVKASYEPVDLTAFTAELASVFRSAIERAGLKLVLRCEPLPELIYVDREMWEKIVLNLVSNAFKFTFEGEIEVALRAADGHAVLLVRDTGIGVAAHELPRLFERFHRIEGVKARTHEGSGIGLALVQELVRLHGGEIQAESQLGTGTTLTVKIPTGTAHLPREHIVAPREHGPTAARAVTYLTEALRWLPDATELPPDPGAAPDAPRSDARILVVDDNADLREYLRRILGARWRVETASDGASALEAARRSPPNLILTDVMMPGLTGFELLGELRRDPRTRSIPVIMLSARAGEEARVEGLDAGADDYLIKPFSARELVARVTSQLALSANNRERALLLDQMTQLRVDAEAANLAKDQFLAMLSHELRNPLSPMLTALQLMRLRGTQSREQDILERQVNHLTRLVDDLLDVSRITRGKIELRRQDMELADAVVKAIEISSPLLEQRRQHLDLRVARHGLGVNIDPARIAQVISNLLTNAAQNSAPGTRIIVEAERSDGFVRARVRDEGIGIAPEMIGEVFDQFVQRPQTLDRSQGGLGLGLSIVRSIVELHGGTVHVKSEGLGKGSEFVIALPAVELAASPQRDQAPQPTRPLVNRRVLIVDDNADAVRTLKEALEALGHSVEVAHDGPSALRVAEVFRPEIALLDIGLPVMDGYELAKRLREVLGPTGKVRLVALTGYGQDADRQRSRAAGFEEHLVKPVDLATLGQVVDEPRS